MKNKIVYQLAGYFSAVLFAFAIIVGMVFMILFSGYTVKVNRENLQQRAVTIAGQLSEIAKNNTGMGRHGHGYGAYLQRLDDIAMSQVWVVDENAKTIDMNHQTHRVTYEQLPPKANELILEVFQGKTAFGEDFSVFFPEKTITVGVPVYSENGNVQAAVLLHSDIAGLGEGISQGISMLLFSVVAALFLSIALSIYLVMKFVTPIKKMTETTQKIIEGNYQVRNKIDQQNELGFLAKSMDSMAEKLEQVETERKNLDQMKQEFITNVSHELRTPVTVLRGSLELLYDEVITEPMQMKEYHGQMLKDSIHMQRLINDLLELSKLQNANFEISVDEVDIVEVFEDALRSIRGIAKEKELKINFDKRINHYEIRGDYGRLRQMFLIILDNAVKFSSYESEIMTKAEIIDQTLAISIKDFGSGIDESDLDHIFERFYHVKSGQNKEGSGLGLAIAKEIAKRHNIMIRCESQKGRFTKFTTCLPRQNKIQ